MQLFCISWEAINMQPVWETLLRVVVQAIALLVLALIGVLAKRLSDKIGRENVEQLIELLVLAAEQVIGAGRGEEKKQFVLQHLRERRIRWKEKAIEAAIEAAVRKMKAEGLESVTHRGPAEEAD